MPLIRTIQINDIAKIGIWEIKEPESYFLSSVSAQKNIKHPAKRVQHLAGRKLLKELKPDFPVEKIKVDTSGKPTLPEDEIHFSISHSKEYAAAILSNECAVGIDIEKIAPKLKRLAPRFLNEREYGSLPEEIACYTLSWSAKEAIYKCCENKDISFKKHIHVQHFIPGEEGTFEAIIDGVQRPKIFTLHYIKIIDFVLVWVVDDRS